MKETDLAYIAGFIDGEGSISIIHHATKSKGIRWDTRINITNTNKEVLEFISNILPVKHRLFYEDERRNPSWKKRWYLVINRQKDIKLLLELIYSYLILKKKQAEIMLKFIDSRLSHRTGRYTEYEIELIKKLRKLNQKGGKNGNNIYSS